MEKKCNNCADDNIGCNVIREMKKNIDALKRKRCLWDIAISVVGIVWVVILGVFVYRTFCPVPQTEKRIYNLIINNKDAMSEKAKAEIQTHLAEALTNVEERASRAYNEKFAAILAVLSVFGVAWPVIVGFLQFKSNEKELNKIETTSNQAKTASEQATNALVQISQVKGEAEEATKKAEEATKKAEESLASVEKTNMRIYRYNGETYYHMATSDARQKDLKSLSIDDKIEILYKFYFAIESYIRAVLAVPQDAACRRTAFAKINNMCDWIKKIIPEVKSQRLMLDFNFLVDFCSDIPFNDAEKIKIMERLGTIAKSLEEDFSEAEIADLNNDLS